MRRGAHMHVLFVSNLGGERQAAGDTIRSLARQLVNDTSDIIPVTSPDGALLGGMNRQAALDVLLGEGA